MPIYEYRCESCGQELEKIQKFSDPVLTDCPACGKASLVKLVSASAFRLKGSGWYETDFKTGSRKNVAGDSKGSTEAGGKDKTDNKSSKKDSKSDSSSPAGAASSSAAAGSASS